MNTSLNLINDINFLFEYDPFTAKYLYIYKYHTYPPLQESFIKLREQIMIDHVEASLENVNENFNDYVKNNSNEPVYFSYYIVKAACGEMIGDSDSVNVFMLKFSESYKPQGHLDLKNVFVLFSIWKYLHLLRLFKRFNFIKLLFNPIIGLLEFFLDPFNQREYGLVIRVSKKIVMLIWEDTRFLSNYNKVWLIKLFYTSIKNPDSFHNWCLDRIEEWLKKNKDFRSRM